MPYQTKVNNLPQGLRLVITADTVTTGELQWQDSTETATSISAGTVQRFGPFPFARQFTLTHITGMLVETFEKTVFTGGTAGIHSNLTTIRTGENLTVPANSQCVIYDTLTLNGTLDLDGVLRLI
jgi:hypothetical protein